MTQAPTSISPRVRPGEYVFVTADPDTAVAESEVLASVREPEGRSLVIERDLADEMDLTYDFVAAWVTLMVNSSLDDVGLTATVSKVLADNGISCNVIAGLRHDHLLVPHDRVDEVLRLLGKISL